MQTGGLGFSEEEARQQMLAAQQQTATLLKLAIEEPKSARALAIGIATENDLCNGVLNTLVSLAREDIHQMRGQPIVAMRTANIPDQHKQHARSVGTFLQAMLDGDVKKAEKLAAEWVNEGRAEHHLAVAISNLADIVTALTAYRMKGRKKTPQQTTEN